MRLRRNTSPFGEIVSDLASVKDNYSENLIVVCVVMQRALLWSQAQISKEPQVPENYSQASAEQC